jgi:flagellar assembly protein FliH
MPLVQSTIAQPGNGAKAPVNDLSLSALSDPSPPPPAGSPPAHQAPPVDLQALKQEAYNQGMADQAAQDQAKFQQAIEAFAEACHKIDNHRKMSIERSRGDMINLIIALSKKILGQELTMPRNIIATTLRTAIEQAIESEEYYVTLHPEDLALAEEKVPELIAEIRGLERIIFKTDRNITKGGCLLESSTCSVDATIDSQIESMKEFLEEQSDVLPAAEKE